MSRIYINLDFQTIMETNKSLKLAIILILSTGLVQPKTFDEAMDEYVKVILKIGTGICSEWKFQTLSTNAKTCTKNTAEQSVFLTKFVPKFIIYNMIHNQGKTIHQTDLGILFSKIVFSFLKKIFYFFPNFENFEKNVT